jgi:hypothetical protein
MKSVCVGDTLRFFYTYGAMNFMAMLGIRILITNSCTRWHGIFKGSHRMGDGPIFLKTSAPLSLMKTYRMNLPPARSISLDNTFN